MKKKQKQLPFVLGMKLLSVYSFILGIGLLSICFWTLLALSENKSMTEFTSEENSNSTTMPKPNAITAVSVFNQEKALENVNDTEIEAVIEKVKDTWQNLSPFFIGSCGVAVLCGFIQIITSLVILCASAQGAIKRSRAWEIIHVILFLAFLVCFLIPITIDKTAKDGGIWTHMGKLVKILEPITHRKIDMEHVNNLFLFYITVIVNTCGVLLGFLVSHFGISRLKSRVIPGKILLSELRKR